jgi:hypothetical protein
LITVLESQCVVSGEGCEQNLALALSRGLPLCSPSPERADRLAIVGSGPSVTGYLDELRGFDHVWACNGAYNFLLAHGIVPTGFVGVDPLPGLAQYVGKAHPRTTFYLSALCDSAVYDALDGFSIEVWFPEQTGVRFPPGYWMVPGGTTGLTRAPFLGRMLGFRDITIYGADSSAEAGRYCYEHGTYDEDTKAPLNPVMCNGEGPFMCELSMLKQVSQFGVIAQLHPEWKFRCGGLMAAFLRAPMQDIDAAA